jgi:oxaloacetate decarboxylase beta subunit
VKKLWLLVISLFMAVPLWAESRPEFHVTFVPGEVYIRLNKGTDNGLFDMANKLHDPRATRGLLKDVYGKDVGSFVTVFTDNKQAVARVDSMARGISIADVDHLEIPDLGFGYLKFQPEASENYFYMDKGYGEIKSSIFKRGAKGNLYDAQKKHLPLWATWPLLRNLYGAQGKGNLVGICTIENISEHESLGRVTQFNNGKFSQDVVRGEINSYLDQIQGGSGFVNITLGNMIMVIVAFCFLYLAIAKDYEPLLLVPIAFGILIGNMPMPLSIFNSVSVYMIDPVTHEYVFNTGGNSVLGMIYYGVKSGFLPPLIFLGIGALTDFSALLSNPKSLLLGAAAQFGIYAAFFGALWLGFTPQSAAAIGIIGGADGPTAIFTASRLAPGLVGPIAIAAYSYMAMVPVIQPPIMKLLTTRQERLIRMAPGRKVSKFEKVAFPVGALTVTSKVAPGGLPLLGPLFLGNLLRESGVTTRLAKTASSAMLDICTIMIGLGVGASTSAAVFLNKDSVLVFAMGCVAFSFATASGVAFAKLMNVFSKNKVNPLIGAAGVSAVPDSARVAHIVGQQEDPGNFLLQHAMGPNVAGVIGSAIAAGIFLGLF